MDQPTADLCPDEVLLQTLQPGVEGQGATTLDCQDMMRMLFPLRLLTPISGAA